MCNCPACDGAGVIYINATSRLNSEPREAEIFCHQCGGNGHLDPVIMICGDTVKFDIAEPSKPFFALLAMADGEVVWSKGVVTIHLPWAGRCGNLTENFI